jgi:CO/xanthine dehydrogenase FAD-binding subunit
MTFAVKQMLHPGSAGEVVDLLAQYGERALLLGGGTTIHGLAARGLLRQVEVLVDLQHAQLAYVREGAAIAIAAAAASSTNSRSAEAVRLHIGAMTTMAAVLRFDLVQDDPALGALRDALMCPPAQIRNVATIGGCLASANPLFDAPVALLALDGSVKTLGANGSRDIGLHRFFLDYFEHALEKGEFVAEVRVPLQAPRSGSAFLKLETNANDLAIINTGVRVSLDDAGTCKDIRVVVGGAVGKTPVRALSCEDVLKGERPTEKLLAEAADVVTFDVHPLSDHRGSAAYRGAMAKVYVKRALQKALARLGFKWD